MGIEFVDVLHGILAAGLLFGPILAITIAEHPSVRKVPAYSRR